MTRTCKRCGTERPMDRFPNRGAYYEHTCKDCSNADRRHRYQTNDARRLAMQDASFKARYGITLEQRDAMFDAQGRVCAVCGRDEPSGQRGWHVDHDHDCCPSGFTCGKCVRGILCHACNVGMGNLGDDPDRLIAAATYLLSYASRERLPV